jgi:hypothetical protein
MNITVSVLVTSVSFSPAVEEGQSLIVYSDSVTTLQCVTSASRPAASVTWRYKGRITAIDSSSSSEGSGSSQTYNVTSTLTFTPTYYSTIICCRASNDQGLSVVEREIRLDVHGRLVSNVHGFPTVESNN